MISRRKVAGLPRKVFIALGAPVPALAAALLLACAGGCPARGGDVDVVFAADQLGFLAPCGCSQHQLGGAARAAAAIDQIAVAGPTLFLEGGNLLFNVPGTPPGEPPREPPGQPDDKKAQDRAKAEALVSEWRLGLGHVRGSVWASGPFDDALGADFRDATLSVARQAAGAAAPGDSRLLQAGGLKVGVIFVSAPAQDRAAADSLRAQGANAVLALVQGPFSTAGDWAARAGADLALQSGVVDPVSDTEEAASSGGAVPVFRVKDKGRGLLVFHLHVPAGAKPGLVVLEGSEARRARAAALSAILASDEQRLAGLPQGPLGASTIGASTKGTGAGAGAQTGGGSGSGAGEESGRELKDLLGRKIAELTLRRQALEGPPPPPPADRASLSYRFVALSEDLPESPAATALFRDYTAATGKANLAAQAQKTCPAPPPGALHYAGVASCKDCHPQAFEVYAGTGHVHAYQKLVDKGRQYDLDCIGCHVVGYGKPGGVCRLDRVSGLDNVQCESCHGMGSAHAESGGDTAMPNAKPGYDTCLQCHNPDNDTGFNRERFVSHYLPLVLGPGHGRPAAKR